jgi:putative restriction endonuclease
MTGSPRELDAEVRACAFRWLDEQLARHGDALAGGLLRTGFEHAGHKIPLLVQQGIFKPAFLEMALSLRTAADSPYPDHFEDQDTLVYSYQGDDPLRFDNVAVRKAMHAQVPLVYLYGLTRSPSRYAVVHPVYVVADDMPTRRFRVQAEPSAGILRGASLAQALTGARVSADPVEARIRRAYGTREVRTRLHQRRFRERVIDAYREQCAMCRLRHRELLDAAHIVPDREDEGEPVIANGLSLCKIHHAAFDEALLSVEPKGCRVRVRRAILDEEDGPMLRHGLQGLEGVRILLPRRVADRPDPERLRRHWEGFQKAS